MNFGGWTLPSIELCNCADLQNIGVTLPIIKRGLDPLFYYVLFSHERSTAYDTAVSSTTSSSIADGISSSSTTSTVSSTAGGISIDSSG